MSVMLIIIVVLAFVSVAVIIYESTRKPVLEGVTLPAEYKGNEQQSQFDSREILNMTARVTDHLVPKAKDSFAEKLDRQLAFCGRRMNVSQFMAAKFLAMLFVPFVGYVIAKQFIQPEIPHIAVLAAIGFVIPDLILRNKVAKRKLEVFRDLPYVIDLLNICVGAGLDFMVAVNHVIHQYRSCALLDELKTMVKEIQMGLSRRDALKNMAKRVNTPEINSFVRTLLQADRMGTPITVALKMHSEELRSIRFQRGEEMALKAPIKLLFPLLAFILPVVMIIVAGPILIQFMGGGIKF